MACDKLIRWVIGLDLSAQSAIAMIAHSLFNPKYLCTLNFAFNWFHQMSILNFGWAKFEKLSSLNLFDILVGIFCLTKLTSLDLSFNYDAFRMLHLIIKLKILQHMSTMRELWSLK
ncbi:hypothetical protein IEQ34_000084 [Dendrobium chrysotoxum]|uniref:Uncharacterized protein n=1 Tax=Dendrobium chrysotoxum TaxID=161865 RepID=A0AAV7HNZ7_DENCH|nr:hypothetical protein IEQ34_000084 [Dendrobium chrysotoxum]